MTRLIILKTTEPQFNLAAEEYIFSQTADSAVILWQNKNAVIIGRNQNTLSEINQEVIEKHGISVVRRITGGGAVFHDLGNINYSIIAPQGEDGALNFKKFAAPIVEILSELGVKAEFSGRNDLLIDGRKISGNAQHIADGRVLHHGTLLFSSDLDRVSEVLTVDPEKIRSKAIQSVRSRVTNIKDHLPNGADLDADGFIRLMEKYFIENTDCEISELSENELRNIEALAESKYRTWQWNYGNSPKYSLCRKEYLPCGTVEVSLGVVNGKINEAAIYGDFFSVRPKEEFVSLLIGTEHSKQAIFALLEKINISDYFVGACADDLIKCFF
ncbi:MAG: lipoate--protein ligase [Clostridia bacterium]|nr:lipoate--protein ligase [Clostridia bacterium]